MFVLWLSDVVVELTEHARVADYRRLRAAIEVARAGYYTQFEIQRGLGVTQMLTWFDETPKGWRAKPELRRRLRFEQRNILDAPPGDGRFDLVLLSCKAYDLDAAIDAVAPAMGAGTTLLPILNGLLHYDALDARFGRGRGLIGCSGVGRGALVTVAASSSGHLEGHHFQLRVDRYGRLRAHRHGHLPMGESLLPHQ